MFIRCSRCGDLTWTIRGWVDLDHCASCGSPLAEPARSEPDAEADAPRRRRWDPADTRAGDLADGDLSRVSEGHR